MVDRAKATSKPISVKPRLIARSKLSRLSDQPTTLERYEITILTLMRRGPSVSYDLYVDQESNLWSNFRNQNSTESSQSPASLLAGLIGSLCRIKSLTCFLLL